MNDLEFCFDSQPWEQALSALQPGSVMSAAELLALLEAEDELTVEEVWNYLEDHQIFLDISDLPPVEIQGNGALRLKQEASGSTLEGVTKGLDPNDPLKLYLQELAATPAAGDPQFLAERYRTGEHHLAEQLVNVCLSRVIEIAMEHRGKGVLLMDLIQEGSLGLWQSILRFPGGDFAACADWWIRLYMAKAVFQQARSVGAGQKLRQDMEDYRDVDQRLLVELGRNPTTAEIAEMLHISEEECLTLEKMVANARNMAQAKKEQEEPEPTPEDDAPVENSAYFQLRQRIEELLSSLTPEDAKLLTLRFGLEGGKPLSPVQTGEMLGLTPEQVVTREAEILGKLRNL